MGYGIVVTNTSDQMVVGLPLTYRFVTDDGTVVPAPATAFSDSELSSDDVTVALWPGQQLTFGGMDYRERAGVTRIEVEVGELDRWMPAMAADAEYGPEAGAAQVDVTDVEVGYGDDNEPIVRFDAVLSDEAAAALSEVGQEPVLDHAMVYVAFRDRDGHVIGGADGMLFETTITAEEPVACEIALDGPLEVPGIDPTKVDVTVLSGPLL